MSTHKTANTHLDGDRRFKVRDADTWYTLRDLTEQEASDLGCPGANAVLVSQRGNGYLIGTLRAITGRTVRVPQSSSAHGKLSEFSFSGSLSMKGHDVS